MSARIEPLDPAAALGAAGEAGIPTQLAELNVFRLLLRRPSLAKGLAQVLLALLRGDALDARHRELAIMRIAWVTGSGYEWSQHWRIASDLGIPPEELLAVRDWRDRPEGPFDGTDRAVLEVVDAALAGTMPADRDLQEIRSDLGEDALIDLIAAVGAWSMVSLLLRTFDVPLEENLQVWPPDGQAPSPA